MEKKSKETKIPTYVHLIKKAGLINTFFASKAKVIVDNGVGLIYTFTTKKQSWKYRLLKNKKQYDVSTCHGTPLKKIGKDIIKDRKATELITISDVLVLGNTYVASIFQNAFSDELPIALYGTPRNDILLKINKDTSNRARKKLGLPINKKLVLYAPTYRDDVYESKNPQRFDYLMNLDIENLLLTLSKRFGGEWVLIFRGHQFVDNYIAHNDYFEKYNIIDGNLHDDMAEYLVATDVLITDYSGSLFDFALTKKTCFLYTPDKDYYINYERGIYGNMDSLPYKANITNDELKQDILNYEEDEYKKRINEFMVEYGYTENGKASKLTAELIKKLLTSKKQVNIKEIIEENRY